MFLTFVHQPLGSRAFLRRKLGKAPTKHGLLVYNKYVRSKIEYVSVIWDPQSKQDIQKLEILQRKAVRFIYGKFNIKGMTALLSLCVITTFLHYISVENIFA